MDFAQKRLAVHRIRFMRIGQLVVILAAALLSAGSLAPNLARAQTEIDVNQGQIQPLPIAIPDFSGAGETGADIVKVISANLDRSGLFRPLDPASFPDKNLDVGIQPNFNNWKASGAQALVNGQTTIAPDGRL